MLWTNNVLLLIYYFIAKESTEIENEYETVPVSNKGELQKNYV